jgi:precorrin-6B methylase 2
MKLRDFFLPKISRSNPQVRKEAVRRENNMSLLQQISKQDKDPEVRQLALKRLKKLATSQMFREKMRS